MIILYHMVIFTNWLNHSFFEAACINLVELSINSLAMVLLSQNGVKIREFALVYGIN